jgi:OHCU decarboxylase
MTWGELNGLEEEQAYDLLLRCCGSTRWAEQMTGRRPFATTEAVHSVAASIWWSLEKADWLEAFAAHPRIGEKRVTSTWSSQEQKEMASAATDTTQAIAAMNDQYESRFGYIFIVCATGRSAEEMRSTLEQRLGNEPEKELLITAEEQMKITHLRLDRVLAV